MALPDFTTQDPATYKANIDAALAALATALVFTNDTAVTLDTKNSVEFTGMTAKCKRFTIYYNGASQTGSPATYLTLSGATGGYTAAYEGLETVMNALGTVVSLWSTSAGVRIIDTMAPDTDFMTSSITFTLVNDVNNVWEVRGMGRRGGSVNSHFNWVGLVTLSGVLDGIKIATTSSTWDAGEVNVSYEDVPA